MKLKIRRDQLFKILDWMMIPILGSLSYFFIIEAWNDYRLGKTNMSFEEIPFQGQPIVVICADNLNDSGHSDNYKGLIHNGQYTILSSLGL